MWIILGALLSFSVFALDLSERINNVKILRVLPENIVLFDVGLEGGITRNDHGKLITDAEGFAARAICIRSNANTSYWKLYRVPNSEAISLDYTYTIVGIEDKEIPYPEATIRDTQQTIPDIEKKDEAKPTPDPFAIKRDLPERLTERDLLESSVPAKRRLFVEEALDQDRLGKDLTDYRISLYASPFTRQSINDGESLRYGFRGGNKGSRYRLLTQFEQQQTKLKDPLTQQSVSTRSTTGQGQFIIHRLTPDVSSLSIINYNSTRFSSLGTPRSHWQVGPIGFTWHLYESKSWEFVDLSYVPLYDMRHTDVIDVNGLRGTEKTNGLRHGFRLALKTSINERVALENLLWVRPYQDLGTWAIEGDNLNLVNDLKLIFNLSENFFFDYNLVYQKDKLWKTLNNLPEDNVINSLNLRYDFNL